MNKPFIFLQITLLLLVPQVLAQDPPLIEKIVYKGKEHNNIKAISFKGGRFGFTYDSGVFGIPITAVDFRILQQVKASSPEIAEKAEFKELLATFIEKVRVGYQFHYGVRLTAMNDKRWTIQTDAGSLEINPEDLSSDAKTKLEQTHLQFAQIERRFEDTEKQKAKDEAAHFAREELEKQNKSGNAQTKAKVENISKSPSVEKEKCKSCGGQGFLYIDNPDKPNIFDGPGIRLGGHDVIDCPNCELYSNDDILEFNR